MKAKYLSFHLFKRVEKKGILSRLRDFCSTPTVFSSSSSSSLVSPRVSNDTTGGLFTVVPPYWSYHEFSDVKSFINDYIDNTGTFDENSKTGVMIKNCDSVIIIEDSNYNYLQFYDNVEDITTDRIVVAAIIISNQNPTCGLHNLSLNESFENPVTKIMVDDLIFNESVKSNKRRGLAMIIIHHLIKLCKVNEIASIDALLNDETLQYFLDSGFSHNLLPVCTLEDVN